MFRRALRALLLAPIFGFFPIADAQLATATPDPVRVTVSMNADGTRTTYEFDSPHHRATATTTGKDGKIVGRIRYTLDDASRFATGEVYGADDKLSFKTLYKYERGREADPGDPARLRRFRSEQDCLRVRTRTEANRLLRLRRGGQISPPDAWRFGAGKSIAEEEVGLAPGLPRTRRRLRQQRMIDYIQKGGLLMWPILACSVIAIRGLLLRR